MVLWSFQITYEISTIKISRSEKTSASERVSVLLLMLLVGSKVMLLRLRQPRLHGPSQVLLHHMLDILVLPFALLGFGGRGL